MLKSKIFTILFMTLSIQAFAGIELEGFYDKANCELKSDKVVLFFWATWCPTCKNKLKEKIPDLKRVYPQSQILPVNIDKDLKRAKHYLRKNSLVKMQICFEPSKEFISQNKITSAPYVVLLKKRAKQYAIFDQFKGFKKERIKKFLE